MHFRSNLRRLSLTLAGLLIFCWAARAEPIPAETNLWVFVLNHGDAIPEGLSTPAVAPDGTVYQGTFYGNLYAITPEGKERWHFQAGNEIKSSPSVADDGTVYFGARNHRLYAVTPAGKLKWKFLTGAWVDSSPAIGRDGAVYFGSWDKNFYALNPDGSLKWKFATGGVIDSSAAIAADGTIYFGSHDKIFYALDTDGKPRWSFPTEAEITSSPAIGNDGSIYFTSTDGNLYRLRPDGTETWRCRIGGGSDCSPILAENGNIFIGAGRKQLIVSNAGAIIWNFGGDRWVNEAGVAIQGGVCFPVRWHELWALNPEGKSLWWVKVTNSVHSSLVTGNQGELFFGCERTVQALQPPVTISPAKSSWPMFRADARHTGRVKLVEPVTGSQP